MNLRNKTASEFRAVFDSPLGVPNSQVSLYKGYPVSNLRSNQAFPEPWYICVAGSPLPVHVLRKVHLVYLIADTHSHLPRKIVVAKIAECFKCRYIFAI